MANAAGPARGVLRSCPFRKRKGASFPIRE